MLNKLQRGIISITSWVILGLGAAVLVEGIVVKVQTSRLASKTAQYDQYKGGVEALGRAAQIAAAKANLAAMKNKERVDEETKRVAAVAAGDARRLRDSVAGRSAVPGPGPGTERPDLACFDRTELDAAVGDFQREAAEIAIEGAAAVTGLNLAKSWALARPPK